MVAKSRFSFSAGSADPSIQIKLTKTVHFTLIEHDTHLRPPEIDLKKSADILKTLFA